MTTKTNKNVLTKADFFNLKTKIEPLEVEGLGTVYIKTMTASEREGLENHFTDEADKNGIRALVFIYSVCEEDGTLVFGLEDLEKVKGLPSKIVSDVFNKSDELNSIVPKNQAVAEAAKN